MASTDDIEFEVDDIKDGLDDTQSRVSDLEDNIKKINEDLNIWGLLDEKMIPSIYQRVLNKSLINLGKTSYKNRVNVFHGKSKDNLHPLDEEKYRNKTWRENKILRCTTFLRNSKEFFHAARVASIDTQPILYYYSVLYLFSFLIESFIDLENPKLHHGLYVESSKGIDNISFGYAPNKCGSDKYVPRGFFERLVNTLSILNYPSSFSSFIPDHADKYIILGEQKTELSILNTNQILLDKLLKHDFKSDMINIKLKSLVDNFDYRYQKTSVILKDYILIFISSTIARYDPKLWRQTYFGEETDLIFFIRKSFGNINNMIRLVNDIITEAEKGNFPSYGYTEYSY